MAKRKARQRKKKYNLAMHDLGHVDRKLLIREADVARSFLNKGLKSLESGDLACSMDKFFKAAAIASNVVFTDRTHDSNLPERTIQQMLMVTESATRGIMRVFKLAICEKLTEYKKKSGNGTYRISKTPARVLTMGRKCR